MDILHAIAGLALLIVASWAMSENRARVHWRIVASGIGLMVVLAALLLKVPPLREAVFSLNGALNALEKANCLFCSYANGLLAYVSEIAARTEQYWCPIKHARVTAPVHHRYHLFFDYGDAAGYRSGLAGLRQQLRDERGPDDAILRVEEHDAELFDDASAERRHQVRRRLTRRQ